MKTSEKRVVESQCRIDCLDRTIADIIDKSQQRIQSESQSLKETNKIQELQLIIIEKDRELERVTSLCKRKLKEERMKRCIAGDQENAPVL